ncbi:MAG: hypothetical protein RLZZ599_1190 [Bacteroidota bacterium]|jgi:hypothetical protein
MKKRFIFCLGALTLSACTTWQSVKDVEPSNPDCICTMEYDPVCVQGAGVILRYSNLCNAQCDGFTVDDLIDCE